MKPRYITDRFPKFLEKHGFKHMPFHDLRHCSASLLLANGVQMKQIQEWLGHSDFSTTANGKTSEYNLDFRSGTTGIFQKSQKFCPDIQQFCPLKIG